MKQKPAADLTARPAAWNVAAVPGEVYAEVEAALVSPDSPVGIDAKRTHVLILHALDRIERQLAGGSDIRAATVTPAGGPDAVQPSLQDREVEVRRQVRALLAQSPAFSALKPKRREKLAEGLTRAATHAAAGLAEEVDFPAFVANLLQGTFEAIVNSSIEQMDAYAELVDDATRAADEFVKEASSERLASQRQQLVATMVLMGVNRVEVRKGKVRTRGVLAQDEDD